MHHKCEHRSDCHPQVSCEERQVRRIGRLPEANHQVDVQQRSRADCHESHLMLKSFSQFANDDDLDESAARNVSAAILVSRIHDRSRKVHATDDLEKKLNLIASQNTHLAAMIFAMSAKIK